MRQIFISYSRKDSTFALQLRSDLQAAGLDVWMDTEIAGGQDWRFEIQQAIDQSETLILILSKASLKSEIVRKEYTYAQEEGKTVIPLMLQQVKRPFALTELNYLDFQNKSQYTQNLLRLLKSLDIESEQIPDTQPGKPPWIWIGTIAGIVILVAALIVFLSVIRPRLQAAETQTQQALLTEEARIEEMTAIAALPSDTATPTETEIPIPSATNSPTAAEPDPLEPTGSPTPTETMTATPSPTATPLPTPFGGGSGKIVFVSDRDAKYGEIYVMDMDGENLVQLTDNKAYDSDPELSPDGEWVVYASNQDGDYEIYKIDLTQDDPEPIQLTDNRFTDYQPSWSRDGQKIAFSTNRTGDSFTIYVMEQNGRYQTRKTDPFLGSAFHPSWSPDNTTIIFSGNQDQLKQVNILTGEESDFAVGSVQSKSTMWSPDGETLVYSHLSKIFTLESGEISEIFNAGIEPAWSPDGNYIILSTSIDGNPEIYRIDRFGRGSINLTDNLADDGQPHWGYPNPGP